MKEEPSGFPLYFVKRQPRVITGDAWAYFRHVARSKLPEGSERQAISFVDQASEFFDAASTPRIASRPLLYYYSFFNIVKAFLLVKRVGLAVIASHGVFYPKRNKGQRMRFEGQRVGLKKCAHDHSEVFPELVKSLGGEIRRETTVRVVRLLRQIPSIHRTFCRISGERSRFMTVRGLDVLRKGKDLHVLLRLSRNDRDVKASLRSIRRRRSFRAAFRQVASGQQDELWFETAAVEGVKKGTDNAIAALARSVTNCGVWCISTPAGPRWYIGDLEPREVLPQPAATLAAMFYLGSITRYQPYDFDRILARYDWLVSEFLRIEPLQFLACLASNLEGVDVVRPFGLLT